MAKNINRAKSSLAKNAIPNIVGMKRTTAQNLLTSLGFNYTETVQSTSSQGDDNTVVKAQDISADSVQPLNTTVNSTVYQFGFTPFGFAPVYFFAAVFFFTAFSFTPGSKYCVDEDTPILIVGDNDSIEEKLAKDLKIGDEIWSATFDEYIDESQDSYKGYLYSRTLSNLHKTKSNIVNIIPETREQTLIFNDDMSKRFSLTERMLMKRNNIYQYIPSQDVEIGDSFIQHNSDGSISEALITNTEVINETRTVYRFTVEPIDHLFAGNMLVHNFK